MKTLAVALISCAALAGACKKTDSEKAAAPAKDTPKPAEPAVAPTPDPPKPAEPAAVELVEIDVSALGPAFKGYVAMAPKTAKIESDESSHHISLSDTDFITLDEAPYWDDGIAALEKDKDNSNLKKVSATEVRYERNPPIGKMFLVETLIKVGTAKWSCGTGLTGPSSAAVADQIATICKSIKQK